MIDAHTETLDQFLDRLSDNVEVIYREHGEVQPFWHAVTHNGTQIVVPSLSVQVEREMLPKEFAKFDVMRCAFVDQGSWEQPMEGHDPQQPMVMIWVQDQYEGNILAYRPITDKGLGTLVKVPGAEPMSDEAESFSVLPPRRGPVN